ncbi:MAG: hypothetical protein ACLFVR_00020 [Thiohalospira sp.]
MLANLKRYANLCFDIFLLTLKFEIMKTLDFNQMEEVEGGSWKCAAAGGLAVLGTAAAIGIMVGTGGTGAAVAGLLAEQTIALAGVAISCM